MRKIWSIITPLQSSSIMSCLLTHLVLPVNAFCKTKFCVGSSRLLNTYVFNSLNNSSEITEHWHPVSMGEMHILLCTKISIYDHSARLPCVRFVSCLAQYSKWDFSGIRVKFIDADEFLYYIWIFVSLPLSFGLQNPINWLGIRWCILNQHNCLLTLLLAHLSKHPFSSPVNDVLY